MEHVIEIKNKLMEYMSFDSIMTGLLNRGIAKRFRRKNGSAI